MQFFLNGRESTLSDFIDDDLPRAVVNSLFCWRRAEPSDVRPGTSHEGWWGDSFAAETGDRWGSRLWLLAREKLTPDVVNRAKQYAEEALQWLIDDGIAASVQVDAEVANNDRLNLAVTIFKPAGNVAASLRFQDIWSDLNGV